MDATILHIQRFSVHDGPGIRSTVFFKGCPLRCAWCHNPESQSFAPELSVNGARCTQCGKCASVCPAHAVHLFERSLIVDRATCRACGVCVEECLQNAREIVGRRVSIDEVMDTVARDEAFYAESGGGVTLSGGECLAQIDAAAELLLRCKQRGLHTAVDTCGYVLWESLERAAELADLFLYDVKLMDRARHKAWTGVDNALILDNLHRLAECGARIALRLPLIDEVNASEGDIDAIVRLAKEIRPVSANLLPYHNTGQYKYDNLGRSDEVRALRAPDQAVLERAAAKLEAAGIATKIGG